MYLSEPLREWKVIYKTHEIDETRLYNSVLNIYMNNFYGPGRGAALVKFQVIIFGLFLRYA